MNAILAYFIPDYIIEAGGLELRKAQIAIKATLFLLAWSPPTMIFIVAVSGPTETVAVMAVASIGFAIAPFMLRWTGSLTVMSNFVFLPLYMEMTWFAIANGGLHGQSLTSLIYLPIMALVFQNRRSALGWLGIALATWTALFIAELAGHQFPQQDVDEVVLSASRLLELGSAGIMVFALVSLKDTMQDWLMSSLRHREAETAAIIETAPDGIIGLALDGTVISSNAAAQKIFGREGVGLAGMSIFALIPSLSPDTLYARRTSPLADGSNAEHEGRSDHGAIPIEIALGQTSAGETTTFVLVVRDITERKKAEEDLVRARDAAQEASRAKSSFLANMSHELRTPLNAVIGYSEMIMEEIDTVREDGDEGAEIVEQFVPDLARIRGAGKHLLSIINDILDLSRIEAGKMTIHVEFFDLDELLEDIVSTVKPLADKNGNRVELVRSDDAQHFMRSDVTKVRQILFNLISNACKFTQNGSVRLIVEHDERTASTVFRVRDTGIGMNAEQMARIFDAFAQADSSTTREFGGTGLGLTITHHFCNLLGGSIDVTSEPGSGTEFVVRLASDLGPTQALEDQEASAPATTAGGTDSDSSSHADANAQDTVLVVDDDPIMRDLLRRVLERDGFRVVTAASGAEGLVMARELRPCAITLDVMMPAMDGWTMLARLKDEPTLAAIPVVMVTMVSEPERGLALGAEHYLTKPLDRAELLAIMQRYRSDHEGAGHLLVVEDDEPTRSLMERILTQDGWTVTTANNGVEALEALERVTPALVLLDLMMPRMDGFEFLHRFRQDERHASIPVVVVTAKQLTPEDEARLSSGVSRVLAKGGSERDHLLNEVRNVVTRFAQAARSGP